MNEPQLTQIECNTILNLVFKSDTPQKNSEDALKYIEDNFTKQQNLVPIIVDFYINSDFTKPVIELLCKVPEILVIKIFDKLNEYLKTNNVKLDKIMALLISMAYKTKSKPIWCQKLIQHALFLSVIRSLNAKSNTPNSNTEYLTTQTCLLFTILMNTTPSLLFNHTEIMFQIVFNSYKSVTSNEQQQHYKKHYDSNANNTVKWSMKLFFYIFYGLFPHLFIQCLRKKDNQTIHKDAINSLLHRLRMHPALIKEKPENAASFAYATSLSKPFDDATFEWLQYCLDENYTNMSNRILTAVDTSLLLSQQQRVLQRQASINSEASLPLSPSYMTKSIQEYSSSSSIDKQRVLVSQTSTRMSKQSSIPSTPLNNNLNELLLQQQSKIFNFPSNDSLTADQLLVEYDTTSEQQQRGPIKNLTAQFMQSPDEAVKVSSTQQQQPVTKTRFNIQPLDEQISKKIEQRKLKQAQQHATNGRFSYFGDENSFLGETATATTTMSLRDAAAKVLSKHKSLSDSNLNANLKFYERRPKAQTAIGDPLMNDEQQQRTSNENLKYKQIRSEMRDSNIIRDPSDLYMQPNSIASASESNIFNYSDLFSRQCSMIKQPHQQQQHEPCDILNAYLTRANSCSESTLKREYETLCHELMYERYLREKYENYLNKAFAIKIENEQLMQEKADLESLYRKAIENQQDFENSLNKAIIQQLAMCKEDLGDKNKQLEVSKQKQNELETKFRELQTQFEEQKVEFKKLERKWEHTEQALDSERQANKHYKDEAVYIKSLRNMTEDLRKKLLIMTKMSNRLSNGGQIISNAKYFQLNALYNEEIDELNRKIGDAQHDYNRLLSEYKAKDAKIFELENELTSKNKQIDDLNQQIYNSIAQINANLYKNNSRMYKSVLAINARLESEIIKLKSEKSELQNQLLLFQQCSLTS